MSSRLDYCNSLFLSLIDFELRRLQLVQNSLCRVITHSSKFSDITAQLKKLHWLPVRYRVQFKVGLITYKILNQSEPVYLRELIHPTLLPEIQGVVPLNSSSFIPPLLTAEFINQLNTFSNSFSHYAPILWNSFPFQIRNSPSVASFRKRLKTHLFNSSFPT